jgi:NADH-quinone oxidoreductase subunit B
MAKKLPVHPPAGGGGSSGADFFVTRLEEMVGWARSNSLWPFPFATACCGIEFMSVAAAHYDISRFGSEVVRFSPRQADLLIVAGTVTDKMAPVLRKIYDQMPEPKWVISMGVCASSGGFPGVPRRRNRDHPGGRLRPGCPPTPEELIFDPAAAEEDRRWREVPRQPIISRRNSPRDALRPPSSALSRLPRGCASGLPSRRWRNILRQMPTADGRSGRTTARSRASFATTWAASTISS